MQRYAHITGWGKSVPERVLTNDELARTVDTSNEWIVGRTGIRGSVSPGRANLKIAQFAY
jgi:3-oxoacyl-[acyl-carrier-protein] synthase III